MTSHWRRRDIQRGGSRPRLLRPNSSGVPRLVRFRRAVTTIDRADVSLAEISAVTVTPISSTAPELGGMDRHDTWPFRPIRCEGCACEAAVPLLTLPAMEQMSKTAGT
jgi:hypothetical protein